MGRHTDEEKIDLLDIMSHDGLKPLIAEMDAAAAAMEQAVVKYELGDIEHLRNLKLRAEGARALVTGFVTRLNNLKAKSRKT